MDQIYTESKKLVTVKKYIIIKGKSRTTTNAFSVNFFQLFLPSLKAFSYSPSKNKLRLLFPLNLFSDAKIILSKQLLIHKRRERTSAFMIFIFIDLFNSKIHNE